MFAAVGIQVSEADFSFKSDLLSLWLFRNTEMSFIPLQTMDEKYNVNIYILFLEGSLNLKRDKRRQRLNQERRPVLLPHLPVPSTPPSSTVNPTPPQQITPLLNSEGQQDDRSSGGAPPINTHPPVEENTEVQAKQPQPDAVSVPESMKLHLSSTGPSCSPSPSPMLSHGSLSDLSRPPSSVFSRSTELSGWISGLSGKAVESH